MIVLLFASLNDLEIFSYNIGNYYNNINFHKKVCTESGTEFVTDIVMVIITTRALNGIKSYGSAWRSKLSFVFNSTGYKSYETYTDVYKKRNLKPTGEIYYKYTLCYVDDFLQIFLIQRRMTRFI